MRALLVIALLLAGCGTTPAPRPPTDRGDPPVYRPTQPIYYPVPR